MSDSGLLQRIFPDKAIGFDITDDLVALLEARGAFDLMVCTPADFESESPVLTRPEGVSNFSDTYNFLESETAMAEYFIRFNEIISEITGHPIMRSWSARHSAVPIQDQLVSRKPDMVGLDFQPAGDQDSRLYLWSEVVTVVELTIGKKRDRAIHSLAEKALAMKAHQHIRPFIPLASFFSTECQFVVYDQAGCQRENISYTDHKALTRLIAGLSFASKEHMGYDVTVKRDKNGSAKTIYMDGEELTVYATLYKSVSLRGRSNFTYLVYDKTGAFSIVKDTWADLSRTYNEADFLKHAANHNVPHLTYIIKSWDVTRTPLFRSGEPVVDTTDLRRDPNLIKLIDEEIRQMELKDEEQRANNKGKKPQEQLSGIAYLEAKAKARKERKATRRERRVHRRLWMGPVCTPLVFFTSPAELVGALADIMRAHKGLYEAGILHRDLSIHNLAFDDVEEVVSRAEVISRAENPSRAEIVSHAADATSASEEKSGTPPDVQQKRTRIPARPRSAPLPPSVPKSSGLAVPQFSQPIRVKENPRAPGSAPPRRNGHRRGVLLDLDYAAWIDRDRDIDSNIINNFITGTVPFIAMELLNPKPEAIELNGEPVSHKFQHDVESLISDIAYIGSLLEMPGHPRPPSALEALVFLSWITGADAAAKARNKGESFIPDTWPLKREFSNYFQERIGPLLDELVLALFPVGSDARLYMRASMNTSLTHDDVIDILEKHYDVLTAMEMREKQAQQEGQAIAAPVAPFAYEGHKSFTEFLLSSIVSGADADDLRAREPATQLLSGHYAVTSTAMKEKSTKKAQAENARGKAKGTGKGAGKGAGRGKGKEEKQARPALHAKPANSIDPDTSRLPGKTNAKSKGAGRGKA
ncbi:hypothetical protein BV25DRAFT_1922130 [Artomyces pyxidatus]|uniref:Uncharacterized protein n=1 Tax=Artomyces pyxidatus TaxID=48021 RepID=A0ACB8SFL0_9AGAM|nr:hypothetical protein BV25DRAFT_1922130 [Artomyces pyxidatus]